MKHTEGLIPSGVDTGGLAREGQPLHDGAQKSMIRIPQCMSTQHPDNVNLPFFAESLELSGEDEVQEAYYVYSHLGCTEQMWDCEGKEVDNFVVRKLLSRYDTFFREKRLGRDVFLTLRVPNPEVETAEAKILLETLESIPRSFDTACLFYGDECPRYSRSSSR